MDLWALDPGPAPVFWRERLGAGVRQLRSGLAPHVPAGGESIERAQHALVAHRDNVLAGVGEFREQGAQAVLHVARAFAAGRPEVEAAGRSEENTSELQSLMRISYAVFCLKKKKRGAHTRYK